MKPNRIKLIASMITLLSVSLDELKRHNHLTNSIPMMSKKLTFFNKHFYYNMKEDYMKKKIGKLFNNLCCSQCKNSFDENSITIKREEEGLTVIGLECQHCGKNFGVAFLGFTDFDINTYEPLEVQEGPDPINYDDVIDAHRFIQNLDEDWQKHLPKSN